ncbi:MAG: hypothetical protein J3K34DRAFT_424261 [Monoraphidium minutum]|nr:MAG: hypothetical protein J3K34DRAFT_424261 [Monoraphidium minutum]
MPLPPRPGPLGPIPMAPAPRRAAAAHHRRPNRFRLLRRAEPPRPNERRPVGLWKHSPTPTGGLPQRAGDRRAAAPAARARRAPARQRARPAAQHPWSAAPCARVEYPRGSRMRPSPRAPHCAPRLHNANNTDEEPPGGATPPTLGRGRAPVRPRRSLHPCHYVIPSIPYAGAFRCGGVVTRLSFFTRGGAAPARLNAAPSGRARRVRRGFEGDQIGFVWVLVARSPPPGNASNRRLFLAKG